MKVPRRTISKFVVLKDSVYSPVAPVLRQSIMVEAVYHGGKEMGGNRAKILVRLFFQ